MLGRCVDAGVQVHRKLSRMVVKLAGPDRITQPPAGHCIGLRPAVEEDQPVADRGIRQKADVTLAVIDHVVVDFVRHHRDVGKILQPGNEPVDLALRGHPAGGVGGGIHDQQTRLRRDQRQGLVGRESKAVLLADRHRDRPRAGILDHGAIDGKARIRVEDVDAGLAEHQDRHEHGGLAAGQDHHFAGRHGDPETCLQIGGHGFAQRRNSNCRRIAMVTIAKCFDRRFDDEIGRAEVGLADAEIDDVTALRNKLGCARQHREGVLLADTIEAGNGSQHEISSLPPYCNKGHFCWRMSPASARNALLPRDVREQCLGHPVRGATLSAGMSAAAGPSYTLGFPAQSGHF